MGITTKKRRKIAEDRTLTDVNRRYFGIHGRFSVVNRLEGRRFPAKKGPGNRNTPHKRVATYNNQESQATSSWGHPFLSTPRVWTFRRCLSCLCPGSAKSKAHGLNMFLAQNGPLGALFMRSRNSLKKFMWVICLVCRGKGGRQKVRCKKVTKK